MNGLETKSGAESQPSDFRILEKDLFFYFLDLEVKRASRYQNYLSILLMKLTPLLSNESTRDTEGCHRSLCSILRNESRETDILGSLGKSGLAVLLPYADDLAGNEAKIRFEKTLGCYDFQDRGYHVTVHQFCYPRDGTNTFELIKKALETEVHS